MPINLTEFLCDKKRLENEHSSVCDYVKNDCLKHQIMVFPFYPNFV